MKETLKDIKERRSIRKYKNIPVEKELLEQIVEAGTYAASSKGKQSPLMLCVTNPQERDFLAALNGKVSGRQDYDPFYGAPVVIVVLATTQGTSPIQDTSLVVGNLMLASHSLGLGSCWINRANLMFEQPEGKAFLKRYGIEEDVIGVACCIVGYSDQPIVQPAKRKENYVTWIV